LDEGFGTLDANALDEALTSLERRAKDGRLVAVVSHLKAVAERIENVLVVRRSATGSQASWVSKGERQEFLEQELEEHLLH
jgi:exonuclease SbcC